MTTPPLVSIIIPSYNSEKFLRATIESALAQLGCPCETIVVDDGSTDDTEALCRSFGNKIQYVYQANSGVSTARNCGTRLARGEWLLFLDSDDRLLPTAARDLVSVVLCDTIGVAYGMVIERSQNPNKPRLNGFDYCIGAPPAPAKRNYWRSAVITPGSAIVRAKIHQQIGGFVPTYEPMEDRDYWIKCGFVTSFAYADKVVLDKMWRPASAGSQNARRIWNGLRSRLALLQWCSERSIDIAGLPTDAQTLITYALKEAIWCNAISIIGPLLDEAKRYNVSPLWRWRARIVQRMHFREHKALPHWWIPLDPIK